MSTPIPARVLLRASRLQRSSVLRKPQQCLHTSSRRRNDEPPKTYTQVGPLQYKDVKPGYQQRNKPMRDVSKKEPRPAAENFPQYTKEELAFLRRKYTPEQMAAIEAGEGAISPQDLQNQGVVRNDYMKVDYLDDFSRIHPVLDKKQQPNVANVDSTLRYKTDEEMDEDLARWVTELPDGDHREDFQKSFRNLDANMRYMVGKEEAERQPTDYLAPELNKLTDPVVKRVARKGDEQDYPMKEQYEKLTKQTGLSIKYMRTLRLKVIDTHFVTNQTRMGKIQSMYVLAIAGNGNGLIGIGEGKHAQPDEARNQAQMAAIRNMQPLPRYENRTIYGDVRGKVSATVVELYNRPPGELACEGS